MQRNVFCQRIPGSRYSDHGRLGGSEQEPGRDISNLLTRVFDVGLPGPAGKRDRINAPWLDFSGTENE